MKNLCVQGGRKLYGSVRVQGSKNICLPVMAASILNEGISVIENCPCIDDVFIMQEILSGLGCVINREQNTLIIDTANAVSKPVTADMEVSLLTVSRFLQDSEASRRQNREDVKLEKDRLIYTLMYLKDLVHHGSLMMSM